MKRITLTGTPKEQVRSYSPARFLFTFDENGKHSFIESEYNKREVVNLKANFEFTEEDITVVITEKYEKLVSDVNKLKMKIVSLKGQLNKEKIND